MMRPDRRKTGRCRCARAAVAALAPLVLALCLLGPPAPGWAAGPLPAAMGGRDEAAPATRGNGGESLPEQLFGGSYLGALLFGYPASGFGGVDLLALAALAWLVLRAAGNRKPPRDKDRFTAPRGGADAERDQERRAAPPPPPPPSGNPRDNPWSRKLRGGTAPGRGGAWHGKDGEEADNNAARPSATVRDRAEAMWGHLSSEESGRPASGRPSSAGTVAAGVRIPAGFDVDDFLEGARTLYVRLQNAWAARRIEDIAPFVADELMDSLRAQSEADSAPPSAIDIALLHATLEHVTEEGETQRAGVRFSALLKAGGEARHAEVEENWFFARGGSYGDTWRLTGIEEA